jgi:putative transposase
VIVRETDQSHSSKGINAMTTAHDIDWPAVLDERLTTTHPDVLRELLSTFIHTLMGAEADALCGAGYGEREATPERISAAATATANSTPAQDHWT